MLPNSPFQIPGGSGLPISTVELAVACTNLADTDLMSKSDPLCVLFIKNNNSWMEFGRTEKITDSLSPAWLKKFVIDYKFEQRQMLKFAVYDVDSSSFNLSDHDFLGHVEVSLAEIVAAQSKGFSRNLNGKGGAIQILSEEVSNNKDEVTFTFTASNLDKKDLFGKSDPYLEISRSTESNKDVVVHRTEVIMSNLNPRWKQFTIPVRNLCAGDDQRSLKFSVYDWDRGGSTTACGSSGWRSGRWS